MTDEAIHKYLQERFKELLKFYDTRASLNKKGFRFCSVYVILVSALLSALIANGIAIQYRLAAGLLSASVVIVSGILSQYQFNENWIEYRAAWDSLQRERQYFEARLGEYIGADDPNALFVQRVESISAGEGAGFYCRNARAKPESKKAE